jgi:drug/metabolite transporter (DMT)-like permease
LQKLGILENKKKRALVLTIIAGILWGTSFPVIKIGLKYIDAFMFVFLRFLIAALVMLSIMWFKKNGNFKFERKGLILFLGVTNGVAYLLEYVGMTLTTASKSSLFINLSAMWVALLSPLILKERLGRKKMVGVLAGLLGVFLMTTNLNFSELSQGALIGDLLVLFAGIVWSFFIVYNKRLATNSNNLIQPAAWILCITLLPLLPFIFLSANSLFSLPVEAWLTILYTAIACWVIPYYLWLQALRDISPVTSTIVLLEEIIITVAIASIFLNEFFALVSGIGAFFIIIAIILVS